MGVMSCSRKFCQSIMCDTYISHIGYMCSECQDEFKGYLASVNKTVIPEGEMKRELNMFMSTEKDRYKNGDATTVDDFLKRYKRD